MTPLENLSKLTTLVLSENDELENITPIGKMIGLRKLGVSSNKIKDISAISQITQLEKLYIYDNYIENIESLKTLINLSYVALKENCISDFSPVEYLKQNGKLTTATGDSAEEQDYARCE